jgi:hypothetical protein
MVNNSIISKEGKNTALYRIFTGNSSLSSTSYLAPSKFKIGINNSDLLITDTNLTYPVPVEAGTLCDSGANTFTGTAGGSNSTANTTTYKETTGSADVTAQNLIANGTSASKTWTKASLTNAIVTTKPFALWLYIKDQTTLNKFLTAGTALEIRFRTTGDGATLYYSYTRTAAQLSLLWNWISSNTANVSTLTAGAGGPPSGTINEAVIIITTNNATDTFAAGDVIYDALRQWDYADTLFSFSSGYPTFDTSLVETNVRGYLSSVQALGFLIDGITTVNEDTTPKTMNLAKMEGDSKSNADEFAFIFVNNIE